MHKTIDVVFEKVWGLVPVNSPESIEMFVAWMEFSLHRMANIFQFDSRWA